MWINTENTTFYIAGNYLNLKLLIHMVRLPCPIQDVDLKATIISSSVHQ